VPRRSGLHPLARRASAISASNSVTARAGGSWVGSNSSVCRASMPNAALCRSTARPRSSNSRTVRSARRPSRTNSAARIAVSATTTRQRERPAAVGCDESGEILLWHHDQERPVAGRRRQVRSDRHVSFPVYGDDATAVTLDTKTGHMPRLRRHRPVRRPVPPAACPAASR
jgi:hypothetical protein